MKKLAIILDSFCGRNKNDVETIPHMFFIPLQIEVEGKLRKVGISASKDAQIKQLIIENKMSKTSMPTPADTLNVFTRASKAYEHVIYLPLSTAISGTAKVAMGLAQNFANVSVIESHLVGRAFFEISMHLIQIAHEEGATIERIKTILLAYIKNDLSQVYVIPKSMDSLVQSGRVGKTISSVLERFQVIPVISYEWDNKKLHNRGLKKSGKKAIEFAISKLEAFINNRHDFVFLVTTTPGREMVGIAQKILVGKHYPCIIEETSPVIDSACGQNAVSISAFKKI